MHAVFHYTAHRGNSQHRL